MNQFEPLWYEIAPYIYVVAGIVSAYQVNRAGMVFAIMLQVGAAGILGMRWSYRRHIKNQPKKYSTTGRTASRSTARPSSFPHSYR